MKKESDIIIALCGVFKDHYIPLTRSAFWKMFHRHNDSMESLANSSEKRYTVFSTQETRVPNVYNRRYRYG